MALPARKSPVKLRDSGTNCCNRDSPKCLVAIASDESVHRHKDALCSYRSVFPRKAALGSAIRVGLEFSALCSERRDAKETLRQATLRAPPRLAGVYGDERL